MPRAEADAEHAGCRVRQGPLATNNMVEQTGHRQREAAERRSGHDDCTLGPASGRSAPDVSQERTAVEDGMPYAESEAEHAERCVGDRPFTTGGMIEQSDHRHGEAGKRRSHDGRRTLVPASDRSLSQICAFVLHRTIICAALRPCQRAALPNRTLRWTMGATTARSC